MTYLKRDFIVHTICTIQILVCLLLPVCAVSELKETSFKISVFVRALPKLRRSVVSNKVLRGEKI